MCGSSSTTTTVPFSALTLLASHLPHPELPPCGDPSQNPHDWPNKPFTASGAHACATGAPGRAEPEREERTCRTVRTHLIRLGAGALASGAALGDGRRWPPTPPAPAGATSSRATARRSAIPPTLTGIQAKAATDITERVNDLNAAIAKVNGGQGLGLGPGRRSTPTWAPTSRRCSS